jgi:predicted outer membrane protein
MLGLLRFALLVAALFLLLGLAMAVGSGTTGAAEKVVLIAVAAGIVALLPRIRRIGTPAT